MADEVRDGLVTAIAEVEKTIAPGVIAGIVDRTIVQQAARRRLLAQLTEDPGMLVAGSTRIPLLLDRILLELVAAGGSTVRPPGCARCGRVVLLNCRDGEDRICEACGRTRLAVMIDCVECERSGQLRHAQVGDRTYCRSCWRALQQVADGRLDRFVAAHIPGGTLRMMLTATEGLKADRTLRLALECESFGADWIADPPAASVLFAGFYERLRELGARLPALACGHCGRVGKLPDRLEGRLCCRACYKAGHRRVCDGCGNTTHLESRLAGGDGLCQACTNQLPESSADCVGCGKHRLIAVRTPTGRCVPDAGPRPTPMSARSARPRGNADSPVLRRRSVWLATPPRGWISATVAGGSGNAGSRERQRRSARPARSPAHRARSAPGGCSRSGTPRTGSRSAGAAPRTSWRPAPAATATRSSTHAPTRGRSASVAPEPAH